MNRNRTIIDNQQGTGKAKKQIKSIQKIKKNYSQQTGKITRTSIIPMHFTKQKHIQNNEHGKKEQMEKKNYVKRKHL